MEFIFFSNRFCTIEPHTTNLGNISRFTRPKFNYGRANLEIFSLKKMKSTIYNLRV